MSSSVTDHESNDIFVREINIDKSSILTGSESTMSYNIHFPKFVVLEGDVLVHKGSLIT